MAPTPRTSSRWSSYWRDRFDWRAQERRLNEFDQFTTNIDGLEDSLHPPEVEGRERDAARADPRLARVDLRVQQSDRSAHRPGEVRRPRRGRLHVVAISLPGFGFSEQPKDRGYSPEKMADIIAKLMARLGYTRYGAQGGDWGGIISRIIAINDAQHVAGLHLNFCIAPAPPGGGRFARRRCPQAEVKLMNETQRAHGERARLPADSGDEAADARCRADRFTRRTRIVDRREVPRLVRLRRQHREPLHQGRPAHEHHDLLGHRNGASSTRIYYENRVAPPVQRTGDACRRPARCSRRRSPRPRGSGWRRATTWCRWTPMPRGGHFAALEQPDCWSTTFANSSEQCAERWRHTRQSCLMCTMASSRSVTRSGRIRRNVAATWQFQHMGKQVARASGRRSAATSTHSRVMPLGSSNAM